MKIYPPPAIAAIAIMPITTPAAMPALLGPEEEDELDPVEEPVAWLLAVTTTVCPPTVTTDGEADAVVEGLLVALAAEDEEDVSDAAGAALVTSVVNPVR